MVDFRRGGGDRLLDLEDEGDECLLFFLEEDSLLRLFRLLSREYEDVEEESSSSSSSSLPLLLLPL